MSEYIKPSELFLAGLLNEQSKQYLDEHFIVCQLCKKVFRVISAYHLKRKHYMTVSEYLRKFPQTPKSKIQPYVQSLRWKYNNPNYIPEIRQKMKEKLKGKIPWNKGIKGYHTSRRGQKHSISTKKLMSEHHWSKRYPQKFRKHINSIVSEAGKKGYEALKHKKYNFEGEYFASRQELSLYKLLVSHFGRENIIHDFLIDGIHRIDFFIAKKVFWEHHPRTWQKLYKYILWRRNILNKNGYENYPLVITTSPKNFNSALSYVLSKVKGIVS